MELKQGNSPAYSYYTRFQELTSYLSWGDQAYRDIFYKNLKDEIKDELSKKDLPKTLKEIAEEAISIDNRLYERRQERRNHTSSNSPRTFLPSSSQGNPSKHSPAFNPTPRSNPSVSGPVPMEIDATTSLRRLTPQEKQYRRQHNLCMYCGEAGHFAVQCPNKKPRGPQNHPKFSEITYRISAPLDTTVDASISSQQEN